MRNPFWGVLSIVKKDFTRFYIFFFRLNTGYYIMLSVAEDKAKEKGLCYSVNFCLLLKSKVVSQITSYDNNSK